MDRGGQLLTIRDLALQLNVKEKTLYDWVSLNKIPHVKLNGAVRFQRDRIAQWVSDCAKEPDSNYNIYTKLEARRGGQKS